MLRPSRHLVFRSVHELVAPIAPSPCRECAMTQHGALRDRLECLGMEALLVPARLLPARAALACMSGVSRIIALAASRRRRHSEALVAQRLGLPPGGPEVRRIVAGSFRTLCLNAYEPLLLADELARGRPLAEMVTVEGAENMRAAQAA